MATAADLDLNMHSPWRYIKCNLIDVFSKYLIL